MPRAHFLEQGKIKMAVTVAIEASRAIDATLHDMQRKTGDAQSLSTGHIGKNAYRPDTPTGCSARWETGV